MNEEKDLSVYVEWLVHKELEKIQMRSLADSWSKEFDEENENVKLWNKLRDEEE